MQHYVQDKEGFSSGGSAKEFEDAGIYRNIPKTYDKDAPIVNKLEKVKADAERQMGENYGYDIVDDFAYKYNARINDGINNSDEILIDFFARGDAKGLSEYIDK